MKLTRAESWRDRLLEKAAEQHTAVRTFRSSEATGSRRLRMTVPQPIMAVGVAPVHGGKENDYWVAVRVYPGQQERAQETIEKLRVPRDELDLATGIRYKAQVDIRPGEECGHFANGVGTLGAFVEDSDEVPYILSNNHVLANCDLGTLGQPIVQRAQDGRTLVIGKLYRASPRLRDGIVDAALAHMFDTDVRYFFPREYAGIGELVPRPVADRGDAGAVAKLGAATGVTHGTVSAYLKQVVVDYPSCSLSVPFENMIEFVSSQPGLPFSKAGDSGSLILDENTCRPYALLVGGGRDGAGVHRTVGHFIPDVLDTFHVRFVQRV